jgi:hypothetical protein
MSRTLVNWPLQISPIKIDGLIICSKNFEFFSLCDTLKIPYPLSVKSLRSNKFKFCQELNRCRWVYQIRLCSVHDMDLCLMFLSDAGYVSYEMLLREVENCMERTFKDMAQTPSGNFWIGSNCRKRGKTERSSVYLEDVVTFGEKFMMHLLDIAERFDEIEDVWYVINAMGQTHVASDLCEQFQHIFDLRQADEVVLHTAVDFVMLNHALMWERSAIKDIEGKEPSSEYYPMGVSGGGNYYFKINQPQFPGVPAVKLKKMYQDIFKNVHRSYKCDPPFKVSRVGPTLLRSTIHKHPFPKKLLEDLNGCIEQCDIVRLNVEQMYQADHLKARLEYIWSTLMPKEDLCYNVVRLMNEELKQKGYGNVGNFIAYEMDSFKGRVHSYLSPPLQTISDHLSRRMEIGDYTLTTDEYITIAASEAMICFFLYGLAVSTRNEKRHCNLLCSKLGLSIAAMKSTDNSLQQKLANQLNFFEDGTLAFITTDQLLRTEILTIRNPKIAHMVVMSDVYQLSADRWPISKVDEGCGAVVKFLVLQGVKQVAGNFNVVDQATLKMSHNRLLNKAKWMTSYQFIYKLFTSNSFGNDALRMICVSLRSIFVSDKKLFFIWLNKIADKLESQMWHEMTYFVLDVNSRITCAVIPFVSIKSYVGVNIDIYISFLMTNFKLITNSAVLRKDIKKYFRLIIIDLSSEPLEKLKRVKVEAVMALALRWSISTRKPSYRYIYKSDLF